MEYKGGGGAKDEAPSRVTDWVSFLSKNETWDLVLAKCGRDQLSLSNLQSGLENICPEIRNADMGCTMEIGIKPLCRVCS